MKNRYLSMSITIVMTFAVLFTLQSCSKVLQALHYDLGLQTGTATVVIPPSGATTASIPLGSATNGYNIDSFIKANTAGQLGISNITSVKLASCVITITSGASSANNFANFESCLASFSSNTNTTPYAISVASNPDAYSTSLSLPVDTTAELKSYLNGSTFTYSLSGQLRRATTDTITCTVQFAFKMNVQG